jgi:hypothetical protein
MEEFYPKCFVLSKTMVNASEGEDYQSQLDSFKEHYRFIYAQSILKRSKDHPDEKIVVALNICEKSLFTLAEMVEYFGEVTGDHVCSNTEWEVL